MSVEQLISELQLGLQCAVMIVHLLMVDP